MGRVWVRLAKREVLSVFLFCVLAIGSSAQTLQTLVAFDWKNGSTPYLTSLIQGIDGNFYGTTYTGGMDDYGTVFKISRDGSFTTLHSFHLDDGAGPAAPLAVSDDGSLYGTTSFGGELSCDGGGCGTIFRIKPNGHFTTIHFFHQLEGAHPEGGLVQASNGNFYGTTVGGGFLYACDQRSCGTVFKITPAGVLTTLHSFDGFDGGSPVGNLVQGADGNFYGVTSKGGNTCNCGTIYRIRDNKVFNTLHVFSFTDGATPVAGMTLAADGNFYGTTWLGGANNSGTIFKITPTGTFTGVYNFCSRVKCRDGAVPYAALAQASDGNLYGTTSEGGIRAGFGTIFRLTPAGEMTALYGFCAEEDCPDGDSPDGGLLQSTSGMFYGTTHAGADLKCGIRYGCGTVFGFDVGLPPSIAFVRDAGKVGSTGGILGQGFMGTTSVLLDGTPAEFTVVSDSFIKATVPPGATTGYVMVTTPSGILTSNKPFRVIR